MVRQDAWVTSLVERWRGDASTLRKRGAKVSAAAIDSCIADLESAAREWQLEALTLAEASQESGYTYDSIRRMVAQGELENIGAGRTPRVRRADLPRKGIRAQPDLAAAVRGDS